MTTPSYLLAMCLLACLHGLHVLDSEFDRLCLHALARQVGEGSPEAELRLARMRVYDRARAYYQVSCRPPILMLW